MKSEVPWSTLCGVLTVGGAVSLFPPILFVNASFPHQFLSRIWLQVPFREMDLSYLEPDIFEAIFRSSIAKAPISSIGDINGGRSPSRVRLRLRLRLQTNAREHSRVISALAFMKIQWWCVLLGMGIWQRRWIIFMRVCDVLCFYGPPQEVVVEYKGERAFASLARELDVMSDFKAGVPRTSYMGVVSVWMHDIKVHLAPIGLKSSFSPSVR